MATSSKVQFKLEKLQEQALAAIDQRIQYAQIEVGSYDDETLQAQRVEEWRFQQNQRVKDLAARVETLSHRELAQFKIMPIPDNSDTFERNKAERNLRELENRRTQIVAKSESLVPDEDGNIALTKTQLEEFFGL